MLHADEHILQGIIVSVKLVVALMGRRVSQRYYLNVGLATVQHTGG